MKPPVRACSQFEPRHVGQMSRLTMVAMPSAVRRRYGAHSSPIFQARSRLSFVRRIQCFAVSCRAFRRRHRHEPGLAALDARGDHREGTPLQAIEAPSAMVARS